LLEGLIIANLILSPKIPVPDQIFPASYGAGVTVCNHEKGIRYRGNGAIVMVSDDYAMICAPFPNKRLDFIDIHGINLRKRLVQDVERSVA
jgi:hypothetical protein